MRVEFLGTGGALTTPKPGCGCRICDEAREKGLPYSRSGPSVFVHGPDVLVDTPEEIKDQLNRSRVKAIQGCFYSHWHPDHVMGRRVWEALNNDWRGWPPQRRTTTIYLPEQVAADFRARLGSWEHLAFFAELGLVRIVELSDGDTVDVGDVRISPFRLAQDYVYAFLFEQDGKRLLVAPDELKGWHPPADAVGVDLAVLPMGIAELDPLTGERRIAADHPVLQAEATFPETLAIIDELGASRVLLTHIEEMDELSFDDLRRLEARLRADGLDVGFAYDTMLIDV
jgi:phosphoribosyl 1,2-cyclic phosphate phosphodiesterase